MMSTNWYYQTGQASSSSVLYIMVMVNIDSSAILVEPMKSQKDANMIKAYEYLMLRLHHANIIFKNHFLDNEISEAMKNLISVKHKMQFELVTSTKRRQGSHPKF